MPTSCEKNITEIPVSPSLPANEDLLLFLLPDGTSVMRSVATLLRATPDDEYILCVPSGGVINNGVSTFSLLNFIGQRVRLYRNNIKVPKDIQPNTGDPYFTFNSSTGQFFVVPVPSTGELFNIEAY